MRSPSRAFAARNFYLVLSYLVTAVLGLSRGLHRGGSSNVDVGLSLCVGLALAFLVTSDARLVGRPLPASAGWLVFIFWPVAAPAAGIHARGRKGVVPVLGNAVLIALTYLALARLGLWLSG